MYVITGGSGVLGSAIIDALLAKGRKVVNLSRTPSAAKGVVSIECNLSNEPSIVAAVKELEQHTEPIVALINCAGMYSHQPLGDLTGTEAAKIYTTNIIGHTLLTARLMERIMKDGADVLNISSSAGTKGNADGIAYGSSKWAVRGFTKGLQDAFKGTKSRAICVCPAWFGEEYETTKGMMPAKDLAAFIVGTLELPKKIEISEVMVNAK